MATKLIGVSKMKVNEIISEGQFDPRHSSYDASPFAKKMAVYGRKIASKGQGSGKAGSLAKQKGEDDKAHEERLRSMNQMSAVGSALGEVGSYSVFDPSPTTKNPNAKKNLVKMFSDIEKKTGIDKAGVMKMIAMAEKMADIKPVGQDPDADNDDNDDFDEPDDREPTDGELARQADDAARG